MPALLWDVYCRVVDNLGDAGVCWRLAANLAARGQQVRLVIDDASPLAFMAPEGALGVEVLDWPGPADPGDVVIEAFGCDPPDATVAAMARRRPAPVWINLEYLSAEGYVERSHGLPSPQRNGLTKWFFYPGFTARTGGLLRELGLMATRACFDRRTWLQELVAAPRPGERVITLFCYDNPALPALLEELARQPTLLLVTPGAAQRQVDALVSPSASLLRAHHLPWLNQVDFDHLLWASDMNLVRGEDSLVRAVWAGVPFIWQAYPQRDGAHHAKVEALLAQMRPPDDWAATWRAWNGITAAWPGLPAAWPAASGVWRQGLLAQPDLVTQLSSFVETRPGAPPGC
jgi:uncharacterized repeat protein (TIGR03837 family)